MLLQGLAETGPLGLAWRDWIKQTLHEVVTGSEADALAVIRDAVQANVPADQREGVQALIIDELRRLHEGVLARYGLRPAEFFAWKARQSA